MNYDKRMITIMDVDKKPKEVALFINDRSLPPLKLKKQLDSPIITHNQMSDTKSYLGEDRKFVFPEYNFSDINRIIETEPLVSRTFDRKIILCIKEGFEIVSKNPKLSEYIKKRFNEIEDKTGISFRTLVEEAISGLIRYSNHFFVFKRSKKDSSGLNRKAEGIKIDPIAGIYSVPIETVKMSFNKKGHADAIMQELSPYGFLGYYVNNKNNPIFKRNDFVHFYLYYYGGLSVCPPILIGVKEDIMALRKVEENMELLLYQYLFPLYHYMVGTDERPAVEYPDGTTEVSRTADAIASLPSEGCVVTSHRHKIEVLGAAKNALDPVPALEWYKKRLLAGIASSALDLGEGDTANRSTSDTLSRVIVDFCKYVQSQTSYMFETLIFNQLLLESTFGDIDFTDPENKVSLKFKEIDLDHQTKKENHAAQLYTQGITTHSESRMDIGRDPLDESEQEELIDQKQMAAEKELLGEEAKLNPVAKQAASGKAQGASRSKPSNQHGKKGNSEKRKSSVADFVLSGNPLSHKPKLSTVWDSWIQAKKYVSNNKDRNFALMSVVFSAIKDKFLNTLIIKYHEGAKDVFEENSSTQIHNLSIRDQFLMEKQIKNIFDKIIRDSSSSDLDTLDYRIVLIECAEQARAYNFGRLRALKELGIEEAKVIKMKDNKKILIKSLHTTSGYFDVPPIVHPNSNELIEREYDER